MKGRRQTGESVYSFKNHDGTEIELPVDRRRPSAKSGWREGSNRHHTSVILQFLLLWGSQNQAYVISRTMVYLSNGKIKRTTATTTETRMRMRQIKRNEIQLQAQRECVWAFRVTSMSNVCISNQNWIKSNQFDSASVNYSSDSNMHAQNILNRKCIDDGRRTKTKYVQLWEMDVEMMHKWARKCS